jgi:TfoX/Sxy family transcriptional regulator of competence genes
MKPRPEADEIDPRLVPVVEAFAADEQVSRGKMFGSVGLKVKGKVFVMLVKGRLVAKLPKERVDEIVASGMGQPFDPGHGRLMKEWVAIEGDHGQWVGLAKEARRFVERGAS